jgi:phage terminase large subunit
MLTAPRIDDFAAVVDDPVEFVYSAIGAHPQAWQRRVLRDLGDPAITRIAVKSCHGPGKTAVAAWAALCWLASRDTPKVPCTAPTEHQLYDNLWPEIHKWLRRSEWELWRFLRWTKTRVSAIDPRTGESDPEWFAVARVSRVTKSGTSDAGEAYGLQGFHANDLLFIVDEASGVPDPVFAAIEGALATGRAKLLAIGNPNVPSGWFWKAFHREQAEWSLHTVSYKDSPQVSKKWARSMIRRYGPDHPWVRVRVMGEFPAQSEKGLVGLWAWERASAPSHHDELLAAVGGRRVLGVDVARYGTNRSVIARATGPVVHQLTPYSKRNSTELAGEIRREIREFEPHLIVIDADGPGSGVVDRLREDRVPNIFEWHEGAGAMEPDEFLNIRAELAWRFKQAIEHIDGPKIAIPANDDAEAQAVNIRYVIQPNGKIKLESKDDLAKRMDSPDEFDAIRYALVPFLVGPATRDGAAVQVGSGRDGLPTGLLLG